MLGARAKTSLIRRNQKSAFKIDKINVYDSNLKLHVWNLERTNAFLDRVVVISSDVWIKLESDGHPLESPWRARSNAWWIAWHSLVTNCRVPCWVSSLGPFTLHTERPSLRWRQSACTTSWIGVHNVYKWGGRGGMEWTLYLIFRWQFFFMSCLVYFFSKGKVGCYE